MELILVSLQVCHHLASRPGDGPLGGLQHLHNGRGQVAPVVGAQQLQQHPVPVLVLYQLREHGLELADDALVEQGGVVHHAQSHAHHSMAPLVSGSFPHVAFHGLEEALAVSGAAVSKQHTGHSCAVMGVHHLEYVCPGGAQCVRGVLYGHGGGTLKEVPQEPVHHGRVKQGLLHDGLQGTRHVLEHGAPLCSGYSRQQLLEAGHGAAQSLHAVKQNKLLAVKLCTHGVPKRRGRHIV
mmetsp:Transcript_35571/g.78982  ORF Transcript_35571/g.78982 Transcript_35571/m.78982 type:complete len:238 (+) Transcript_35571:1402-2115(+)